MSDLHVTAGDHPRYIEFEVPPLHRDLVEGTAREFSACPDDGQIDQLEAVEQVIVRRSTVSVWKVQR